MIGKAPVDNAIQSIDFVIPAGEQSDNFRYTGNLLIQNCNLDKFKIRLDNNNHICAYEGFSLIGGLERFVEVLIDNTDNAEELQVTICFGRFIFSGSRPDLQPQTFTSANASSNLTTGANVLLLPANRSRKYWEIRNNNTTAARRIILNNTSVVEVGQEVEANGGYYSNNNQGAIYGHSKAGTILTTEVIITEHI